MTIVNAVSHSKMDFKKKYFASFGLLIKVNMTWKNYFGKNRSLLYHRGRRKNESVSLRGCDCFSGRTSCAEKYFKERVLQTLVRLHVI